MRLLLAMLLLLATPAFAAPKKGNLHKQHWTCRVEAGHAELDLMHRFNDAYNQYVAALNIGKAETLQADLQTVERYIAKTQTLHMDEGARQVGGILDAQVLPVTRAARHFTRRNSDDTERLAKVVYTRLQEMEAAYATKNPEKWVRDTCARGGRTTTKKRHK
ncbi:MAG: hypothetical protein WAX89_03820 [Alphaproteobacteria bacterium]